MCECCDYTSPHCCIFIDPLSNDWYLEVETPNWSQYDDDWYREKVYINYCPFCGDELND